MSVPSRLAAPAPTWELDVDVVVLGSGAAGLAAALAVRPVRSALVVSKDVLNAGSTAWAQGGLAGVLDPTDSLENHVRDTLAAGAGLCDEAVVRELVREAPTAIRYLMRLGAAFDPEAGGDGPALTREGGHSHNRIVHSGGDRSGAEVQRTLDESAMAAGVQVMEQAFALDLVTGAGPDGERRAAGVTVARLDLDGRVLDVGTIRSPAVVLATGGYGQVFASTSNPPAVTGDGMAMALRAGLAVRDVEFVQFHPTVLWRGPDARGQLALVSEAVRGEGAMLYDGAGRRVMAGVHPQEDLAPRDVVAAAISARMAEAPGGVDDHVVLDATHMGERFYERFPAITAACRDAGIDPARDRIPVRPGRALRLRRRAGASSTGRPRWRGCSPSARSSCTGVHGANRLASNSLTESVVAGTRLGRDLAWELPERVEPAADRPPGAVVPTAHRPDVRAAMSRHVGVGRDEASLTTALRTLSTVAAAAGPDVVAERSSWETTNMLTVAAAVVLAARRARRVGDATAAPTSPTRATSGVGTSTSICGRGGWGSTPDFPRGMLGP